MDADEPYLRPCKQLPSPTNDRQASHMPMGQHLGIQSSSQGHVDQDSRDTSPAVDEGDSEDEAFEFQQGFSNDASDHATLQSSEDNTVQLLKGKDTERIVIAQRNGPLRLLDLPLDILKLILKEVTHTNDLANCAKVNSSLHSMVTPMIYSRFDIVWPETLNSAESARGVDALTYGLATLVMREDLFESVLYPDKAPCGVSCQSFTCPHCWSTSYLSNDQNKSARTRKSRRGNYFSQFVKKFSLGNGPTDWVQEYLVTKESGKMLGTLVALSIARMPNLESFVWDMPTGLLRDIWIALSSLGDHRHSKLEKLWIRFHNNHTALKDAGLLQPTVTAQTTQNIPGAAIALPPTQQPSLMDPELYGVEKTLWIDHHVERPNFSTMPSLSSLTVLEIDEVQYLEELSVLLARSISTLRELRLGMASTLNIPPSAQHSSNTAPLFTGGVFALLLSKIYEHTKASGVTGLESRNYDIISQKVTKSIDDETSLGAASANPSSATPPMTDMQAKNVSNVGLTSLEDPAVGTLVNRVAGTALDAIDPALFRKDAPEAETGENPGNGVENLSDREAEEMSSMDEVDLPTSDCSNVPATASLLNPTEKLKLEVLEIERLAKLSPDVLRKTIDLTILTSLTLLQCGDCSNLWVRLRNEFAPRITRNPSDRARSIKIAGHRSNLRGKKSSEPLQSNVEYRLRLKRIHTDGVSSDLIQFLKNTLAPDSLEWLFLQDTETFPSPVTLEAIYRGPIRRHRSSLAKVMIDSAYGPPSSRQRNNAARKWMLSRDVLTFITSGNMCRVRELAVALEYKDWHFFLQRLPNIPHLRSLHVPNISEHPYGNSLNVKDFALGAIDVVALRPEVELCYLGIKNKCFEILELKQKDKPKGQASSAVDAASDDETEDGDHHGDDDEDSDDGEAGTPTPPDIAPGAMDSDTGSITSEEEDEGPLDAAGTKKIRLKLREILFYDDKISIFKARHGRL